MSEADIPLVTDLDDTLIHGDLLLETILRGLAQAPVSTALLILKHIREPQVLKIHLAGRFPLDLDAIPRNPDIEATLAEARAQGRKTVLASGSTESLVRPFADRYGKFDAVFASDATTNLTSSRKAALLTREYGPQGFDYIGDTTKDIKVWQEARKTLVARRSPKFLEKLTAKGLAPQAIGQPGGARDLLAAAIPPVLPAVFAVAVLTTLAFVVSPARVLPVLAGFFALLVALQIYSTLTAPNLRHRPTPLRQGKARLDHLITLAAVSGGAGFLVLAAHGPLHALAALALTALVIFLPSHKA